MVKGCAPTRSGQSLLGEILGVTVRGCKLPLALIHMSTSKIRPRVMYTVPVGQSLSSSVRNGMQHQKPLCQSDTGARPRDSSAKKTIYDICVGYGKP